MKGREGRGSGEVGGGSSPTLVPCQMYTTGSTSVTRVRSRRCRACLGTRTGHIELGRTSASFAAIDGRRLPFEPLAPVWDVPSRPSGGVRGVEFGRAATVLRALLDCPPSDWPPDWRIHVGLCLCPTVRAGAPGGCGPVGLTDGYAHLHRFLVLEPSGRGGQRHGEEVESTGRFLRGHGFQTGHKPVSEERQR